MGNHLKFLTIYGTLPPKVSPSDLAASTGSPKRGFSAGSSQTEYHAFKSGVSVSLSDNQSFDLRLPDGGSLRSYFYGVSDGVPLLYFHGWPGSGVQAALAEGAARELNFSVVSPDRPGIGGSTFQPGRRIVDWPPVVERLAEHLGWSRFHVLAVSGGCPYALATAVFLPDQVESITICCGAALPELILSREFSYPVYRMLLTLHRKAPLLLSAGLQLTRAYFRVVPSSAAFLPVLPFIPPNDRKAVRPKSARTKLARSAGATFRNPPRGALRDATRYIEDWGFDPSRVKVPTTFYHGTEDQNIPIEAARRTAEKVPGACFVEYPGEGHYSLPLNQLESIMKGIPAKTGTVLPETGNSSEEAS